MKVSLRLLVVVFLLLGSAIAYQFSIVATDFSEPCGFGNGEDDRKAQGDYIRREFSEQLPAALTINNFECRGFQDLNVSADLTMSLEEGVKLDALLLETYSRSQNNTFLPDSLKKRLVTTYPDFKTIRYKLPGLALFM